MRADYILIGRDANEGSMLHIFQSPTIKLARKEARRRKHWVDKSIYKLHEKIEDKETK